MSHRLPAFLLLACALALGWILQPFWGAILWAVIIALLFLPLFKRLLSRLTPREREVMDLVVHGRHNREIAEALGISARTVEVHKARMMTKLEVDGVPDLVRLSLLGAGAFPVSV